MDWSLKGKRILTIALVFFWNMLTALMRKLGRSTSQSRIKILAKLRANARWTVPGNSGAIAAGWKVNTYVTGTSTAKDTYTDTAEGTPNTNPVILDSRGEATIYWAGTYKVVVTDENDVVIWTEDDYGSGEVADAADTFNKAKNGSFELDAVTSGEPDDWTLVDYSTGVHTLDATDQYSGVKSLKFTSVGSGGGYATSEYFEVEEAKLVAFTWAMKSSVADVRNVVDVLWATSAKAAISTINLYDDSTTNPTAWTSEFASKIPPSTARFAQIRVYGCHLSDATSGSTWYDNVVINDAIIDLKGNDIASAAALDVSGGDYLDVTGTTTITSINAKRVGSVVRLHFDSALTMTHHATNLVLPGGRSIAIAADDDVELIEYLSGKWKMPNYFSTGSWTPIIMDSTRVSDEGAAYNGQEGFYTRIGDLVFLQVYLYVSSFGTLTTSSTAYIGGLPFIASSVTARGGMTFNGGNLLNITAGTNIVGGFSSGQSDIQLGVWSSTLGPAGLTLDELSTDGLLIGFGHYRV